MDTKSKAGNNKISINSIIRNTSSIISVIYMRAGNNSNNYLSRTLVWKQKINIRMSSKSDKSVKFCSSGNITYKGILSQGVNTINNKKKITTLNVVLRKEILTKKCM